jgi:hypothetical protein
MNVNRPHSAMEFTRNPILKYNTQTPSIKSILSRKSSLNSGYTPIHTKSVSIISPPQSPTVPSVAKLNRHSCVLFIYLFI